MSSAHLQEYLEDQDNVDYEAFKDQVWPNIREIYQPPAPPTEAPPAGEEGTEETTPPPVVDDEQVRFGNHFFFDGCFYVHFSGKIWVGFLMEFCS